MALALALGSAWCALPGGAAWAAQAPGGAPQPDKEAAIPSSVEVLEALWKALRDHYPMMEYVGAQGDAWLEEFRPRVAAAATPEAAFEIMDELVCRLNDYHTRLTWPGQPRLESPAVRLEVVSRGAPRGSDTSGGPAAFRAFVPPALNLPALEGCAVAVASAPGGSGARPGDEVLSVDGVPVREALARAWRHSRGSSTEAKLREACWRMLLGAPDRPVELAVRGRESESPRTLRLPRAGEPEEPTVAAREVGGVPVIRIARWYSRKGEDLVAEVDRLLERYRERRTLIFDVRGNGGGQDEVADQVTGRFLSRPVISSISFHRLVPELTYRRTVEWAQPRGPWRYEGRVAVVTDGACRSACEHFVSGMAEAGALLCGTPTDGACGWIRPVDLPGGARVYVSQTFPLHTGGIPSPLLGIAPHLRRARTLQDLRSGRDLALDAAVEWVKGTDPLPPRAHTFAP